LNGGRIVTVVMCEVQMEKETLQFFFYISQLFYVSALCDMADIKPIIYFCPYQLQQCSLLYAGHQDCLT